MAKKTTEREQLCYDKGYAQGKTDFAKEVADRIACIETCYGDDYDMGVDWTVCKVLKIIVETLGDSDGRE